MPTADPDFTPRCLKCGSDAMIPDVRVIDRGENNARKTAEIGVATKPNAVLFKGEVRSETYAMVCGDCGFIELYADDPATLWEAHVDRASRTFGH